MDIDMDMDKEFELFKKNNREIIDKIADEVTRKCEENGFCVSDIMEEIRQICISKNISMKKFAEVYVRPYIESLY